MDLALRKAQLEFFGHDETNDIDAAWTSIKMLRFGHVGGSPCRRLRNRRAGSA